MTDLRPLLRLRALRETRATHAAAMAEARLAATRASEAEALASIARHDRNAAAQDAMLHDAMIARGFTMADLTDADIRARHASHHREALADTHRASASSVEDARIDADARQRDLRRAVLGHEKLRLATPRPADEDTDD